MKVESLKTEALSAVIMSIIIVLALFATRLMTPHDQDSSFSTLETVEGIGVYWDEKCLQKASLIDWGDLMPGQVRNVVLYVRNEGDQSFALALFALNWNPQSTVAFFDFSWYVKTPKVFVGQVVRVEQVLHVSPQIKETFRFNFDVLFEGMSHFLGDLNRDGIVNLADLVILSSCYMLTSGDSRWNPNADLNRDGVVTLKDLVLLSRDFGKKW